MHHNAKHLGTSSFLPRKSILSNSINEIPQQEEQQKQTGAHKFLTFLRHPSSLTLPSCYTATSIIDTVYVPHKNVPSIYWGCAHGVESRIRQMWQQYLQRMRISINRTVQP